METKEYTGLVDRTGWRSGPWDSEPDKIQWLDEDTKLPCLIHRNGAGGLCGYVGVSNDHPSFGKGYDDIDVSVHGGLTYADKCQGSICHVVEQGEDDDVWWLGFDCVHFNDAAPGYRFTDGGVYRDINYVKTEVQSLAKQLHSMEKK